MAALACFLHLVQKTASALLNGPCARGGSYSCCTAWSGFRRGATCVTAATVARWGRSVRSPVTVTRFRPAIGAHHWPAPGPTIGAVGKRAWAVGAGVAAAGLGAGTAVFAGPVAASQQRPATASFAAYVAAFNSESTANQITLGSVGNSAHLDRAAALKDALRQEPKAVVLGSGLGTFKAAWYHYKPLPVWCSPWILGAHTTGLTKARPAIRGRTCATTTTSSSKGREPEANLKRLKAGTTNCHLSHQSRSRGHSH